MNISTRIESIIIECMEWGGFGEKNKAGWESTKFWVNGFRL